MERIKDLLVESKKEEFLPIVGEYFERNIGDAEYGFMRVEGNCKEYRANDYNVWVSIGNGDIICFKGAEVTPGEAAEEIRCNYPESASNNSYPNFGKCLWTGKYAIIESYTPGEKKVVAGVYSEDTVTEYSKSLSNEHGWHKTTPLSFYPNCLCDMAKKNDVGVFAAITVKEGAQGHFVAETVDKGVEAVFPIEGVSLYDAYYRLMVKFGYFSEDDKNIGSRTNNR